MCRGIRNLTWNRSVFRCTLNPQQEQPNNRTCPALRMNCTRPSSQATMPTAAGKASMKLGEKGGRSATQRIKRNNTALCKECCCCCQQDLTRGAHGVRSCLINALASILLLTQSLAVLACGKGKVLKGSVCLASPSCAHEKTSSPACVHTLQKLRILAAVARVQRVSKSSHSSARKVVEWNHMEWSSDTIMSGGCSRNPPKGLYAHSSIPMSDMYARQIKWISVVLPSLPLTRVQMCSTGSSGPTPGGGGAIRRSARAGLARDWR
mmetsp:Transcript_13144/g.42271  ORF Transcript_13144/g.42271 Transcript_13144/m.42271 type:complete len:265 (+) Transcript_13144:42-836(+)